MPVMFISSSLFSLLVLAAIHLFANQGKILGWIWHGRFLSFASGISFAYVFVDLLPTLEKGQPALEKTFGEIIPYLDLHTYVIALFGVLFYYGIHTQANTKRNFWTSIFGYLFFNFLVGASLSDTTNPEIQPIVLFTIAMGMHYFIQDHNTTVDDLELYRKQVRWWLVAALFIGYFVGSFTDIPDAIVAIGVSFISGGVILNALRYELPKREQVGYLYFVCGAFAYTLILLRVGY